MAQENENTLVLLGAGCFGPSVLKAPNILTEVFRLLLSPFRHMPGQYLKLGHDRTLSDPFQLTTVQPFGALSSELESV